MHIATNKTRTLTRTVTKESFFHFFSPPKVPSEEDDEEEDEEEADDKFENSVQEIQHDFTLGEVFSEKIVPNAINWYTGAALEYEDYDDEDEEDVGSFCFFWSSKHGCSIC